MGVEKAVRFLPVEKAEEAREESVRIIKTTTRTKDNLTKTERAALRTLKDNTHLTILPADKGNATVILNTTDYKQKIVSLLEDSAYKKLKKDPTETIERKTSQLLKNLHSQMTSASNCNQPAPEHNDYMACRRYTKKGSL
jgi:hypothetical protein